MDSKKNIPVQVMNRVAWTGWNGYIICGNTDYTITFTFDEEWGEATAKTARFKFRTDEGMMYTDQPFTGDTVAVPMLSNIREVEVGVYVGDLNTTTGATLRCVPSILCGSGKQSEYEKRRFDELMQLFNDWLHEHKNLKTLEGFFCEASEAESDDGFTILPDMVGVDRVNFNGNNLRYCNDGAVVSSVEEVEDEMGKHLRLRLDQGPLATNVDVPAFVDIPVNAIVEKTEEPPGPGPVVGSNGVGLELPTGGEGGSLTPEQAAQLAANTAARHEHENKSVLDDLHRNGAINYTLGDGFVWTHNHGSIISEITESETGEIRLKVRDNAQHYRTFIINPALTKVSQLENDSEFITVNYVTTAVDELNARIDGIEGGINEIEAMIDESGVLDE